MTKPEPSRDLQRLQDDAEYMHFLVAAGELLSSSLDYHRTLKNVCAAAVETVADICILDVGSATDVERVGAAHRDSGRTPELSEAASYLNRTEGRPAHPVFKVLDSGQTFFAPRIDEAWIERNACSDVHADLMRRMNYRSMIVVPARSQIWGVAGALTLVRTDLTKEPYTDEAVIFAQDLGRRCGIAIGKARLHSQTIDLVERLQRAALPRTLPQVPFVSFDAFYEPADAALLVGGDWYDAFLLKDGTIGISIGDVSGHGIESAAEMSSMRNAIRMALVMDNDLSKVLADADFLFHHEVPEGRFATALTAILDPSKGTLTFASAGHPGPMIWTRGVIQSPLSGATLPLGLGSLQPTDVHPVTVRLEPGCSILFYTDGLIEWNHKPIEGEAAVGRALDNAALRNATSPSRAIRNAVIKGAHADDVAIMVVRYEGN